MQSPQIYTHADYEALSHAAAERFLLIARQAARMYDRFLVVLSGGGTPEGLFRLLASTPYRDALPWNQTHVFWADERCVPPDDPGSNYGQAVRLLLSRVRVPKANLHRAPGERPPAQAAAEYAAALREFTLPGEMAPRFDLVLLGLGEDGHTASLFPGQMSAEEETATVEVASADYQGRPAQRVTLTPLAINAAREVDFLVSGADKAGAVAATLAGPRDPLRWPAQRIAPGEGQVVWMLDAMAAGRLPAPLRKR